LNDDDDDGDDDDDDDSGLTKLPPQVDFDNSRHTWL